MNAIGQYSHIFWFPNLSKKVDEIKKALNATFNDKIKPILPKTLQNCIVDFAFISKDDVKIIEINPFDGFSLGSFQASTGLFNLDNKLDRYIIENGPLELRVKENSFTEKNLKKEFVKNG